MSVPRNADGKTSAELHESSVLAESRRKVRSRTVLADVTLLRSFTGRTFPLVRF